MYYEIFHPSTPSCDCYSDYYSELSDAFEAFRRYAEKGAEGLLLRICRGSIEDLHQEVEGFYDCG